MKKLLFFICLYFIHFSVFAQADVQIETPSANAMSLGVFSAYPSVMATGVPDISIPLYNINYHSIDIPLTLKYNTNLVKPDIHPGWVGLGWNLMSGGSITRIQNDYPDEETATGSVFQGQTSHAVRGYYFESNDFSASDWSSVSKINQACDYRATRNYNDAKPDEFDFSFLGITGSFYLDETQHWKVRCNQKLKVVTSFGTGPTTSFTLIDTKGIQYVFGVDAAAMDYVQPLFSPTTPAKANTWNLVQIILPDLETIDFQYESGDVVISPEVTYWYNLGQYNKLRFSGSSIKPSYLKSIKTKFETITFNRSPSTELNYDMSVFQYMQGTLHYELRPFGTAYSASNNKFYQLDAITVTENSTGNVIKTIKLGYTNDATQRLKLKNISVYGLNQSSPQESSSLFYNNLSLPVYFANQNDYWGFYNHTNPDYSSAANFNNSRAVNPTYLQAEILNQITVPTGGNNKYIFEPHSYSKELSINRYGPLSVYTSDIPASGLRIRRIESYDVNNVLLNFKSYNYQTGYSTINQSGRSSGVLGGKTKFLYIAATDGQQTNYGAGLVNDLPLVQNNNGSNISYSEVSEIYADGSYSRSTYSNFDNGIGGEYMDMPPVTSTGSDFNGAGFISKSFERGVPLVQSIYDNADHLLSQTTNSYTRMNEANEFVRGYELIFDTNDVGAVSAYNGKATKILTYAYLPTQKKIVLNKNATSSLTQTVTDTFDPLTLNKTSEITTDSKGQIVETDYTYATDIVNAGQDPLGVYTGLVNSNIISPVIRTVKKINGIQQVLTSFDYVNPSPGIFVPAAQSIQLKNNPIQQKNQYMSYDDLGNLLCEAKPNGAYESYQWGYNNQFPIVKAENAATYVVHPPSRDNIGITLPLGSGQAYTTSFNVKSTGPVFVSIGFNGNPASNDAVAKVACTVTGPNGYNKYVSLCLTSGSFDCHGDTWVNTLDNLPPGLYTVSAKYTMTMSLDIPVNVGVQYPSVSRFGTITKYFYYEGFEENSSAIQGPAHTGKFYSTNPVVNWTPAVAGTYIISYWYRVDGLWKYSGELTYPSSNNFTMQTADGYDDIRVYSKDIHMSTYTYDPLIGITSVIDAKGQTTYYEYDEFQRLKNIKNNDGNINKHIDYHYPAQ